VFNNIRLLRPHFHSLREVQNNVSLDIKLPLNWLYEDIIKPYTSIQTKIQDKNDRYTLLSLISSATQGGYDVIFACASEIIQTNREEEEKQKLFQQRVKELQEIFKKESLDKLKDINILESYGQENTTGIGVVEQGNGEGSEGDSETEVEDD
jgi:hypothetical protein